MKSAYEWVNKRTRPAKPNNKTMKYKIKTDLLHSYDLNEQISEGEKDALLKEGCSESWFEPVEQVQEGQYWSLRGDIIRVNRVYDRASCKAIDGKVIDISEKTYDWTVDKFADEGRKLSTDEIEQALVKEAKRRFSKGDIVETKENNFGNHQEEEPFKVTFDDLDYEKGREQLYDGNILLYDSGEWAEKIDQTPTIEINGNKVEFNDHPKVGCTTIKKKVFIEQAKTIARHGVRIHRKGEDITDQILAIASHYGYETDLSNTVGEPVTIEGSVDGSITWGFSSENMWGNND